MRKRFKLVAIVSLMVILVNVFSLFAMVMGYLYEEKIPKNFDLGRAVYYASSFGCVVVVYNVNNFTRGDVQSSDIEYSPFLHGKRLQYYLENEIDPTLQVGNAALSGRGCIEDAAIENEYIDTLEYQASYFSYSGNGNILLSYNPMTRTLYYSGWN